MNASFVRHVSYLLLSLILFTTPACLVFQDGISENITAKYGDKSAILTVSGETASIRRFGEFVVDDPLRFSKKYYEEGADEDGMYLLFTENSLGVVEAAIFDGNQNVWTGDFLGYSGKKKAIHVGFYYGSSSTGAE